MRRRDFISALGGAAMLPLPLHAQVASRIRRIGILSALSATDSQTALLISSLQTGLVQNGWVEGQNIEILVRYANGNLDRLAALASELVRANVELIVTSGTPPVKAVRNASSEMPVIFATIGDPVGAGVVDSLARPGGKATGLSLIATELARKRLELTKEIVPDLSSVAILWDPSNESLALQFKQTQEAAKLLGLTIHSLPVKLADQFHAAIQTAVAFRAGALITTSDAIQIAQRELIAKYATQSRIPLVGEFREIAEAGAVFSYGPNRADMWRRAAGYVDKILRGTQPAELPIQQPTRFEFVLNLKAANALDLKLNPMLLARADQVIE
jgi:putative ABC transport system substrate-binding protein